MITDCRLSCLLNTRHDTALYPEHWTATFPRVVQELPRTACSAETVLFRNMSPPIRARQRPGGPRSLRRECFGHDALGAQAIGRRQRAVALIAATAIALQERLELGLDHAVVRLRQDPPPRDQPAGDLTVRRSDLIGHDREAQGRAAQIRELAERSARGTDRSVGGEEQLARIFRVAANLDGVARSNRSLGRDAQRPAVAVPRADDDHQVEPAGRRNQADDASRRAHRITATKADDDTEPPRLSRTAGSMAKPADRPAHQQ